jgi:hypothetical protein
MAKLLFYGLKQGETGKRPVFGGGGFRDPVLGCCREGNGGEKLSALYGLRLAKEGFLDFGISNLVAKRANLVACFFKIVKICVFLAKYLIIGI